MSDTLMGYPIVYTDEPSPLNDNKICLIDLAEFLERQLLDDLVGDRLTIKFRGGKFGLYREGREDPVGFIREVK